MSSPSVTAALAIAGGCGGASTGADPQRSAPTVASTAAEPQPADPSEPTALSTATDPRPAEQIIPVNGDLAEVVYALGLGDEVVATDISATYPPAAAATPKVGYQRTLVAETILAYEPTVVLADDLAGPPEVLDQLAAAGVRVVEIERDRTLEGVSKKVRDVAAALGAEEARGSADRAARVRARCGAGTRQRGGHDVRPTEGARPLPARRERAARVRERAAASMP